MEFPSKEEMRARFYELSDLIEGIGDDTNILRAESNALMDRIGPLKKELKVVNAQIEAIEGPRMVEYKMELATISRAMGNKIGPRPGA